MKLALIGYGNMGREVERVAPEQGHEIELVLDLAENPGGQGISHSAFESIDVAIDFSVPDAVVDNIERLATIGVPMVIGTTGWHERLDDVRAIVDERNAALVYGANLSIGANLFFRLAELGARLFDPFTAYDSYVFEHHHRRKVDAPSGTALHVANIVAAATQSKKRLETGSSTGPIDDDALHVVSLRAGTAFGEHRVGFDSAADSVQIVHRARGREGFARGALFAAEWIRDKKGFFEFKTVIDEIAAKRP